VPHPFPVLGKGAGFDFAFFLLVSGSGEPFNLSPRPFNPQFLPFTAFHLTNRYSRAIIPRVCQAPSLRSFELSGSPLHLPALSKLRFSP
jgi:hypothetical protein